LPGSGGSIVSSDRGTIVRGGNGTIAASPIDALERFVEEGWEDLVRAARRTLPFHDAEDAVQEAASKAVAALLTLRDPESLRPWFGAILQRECRNRSKRMSLESRRFRPLEERSDDDPEPLDEEEPVNPGHVRVEEVHEPATEYGDEDLGEAIRREVERLPEELRTAAEGVWMEARSRVAFGRDAGVSLRTVGNRLRQAYVLLRPRLARLLGGAER
jgi:RNA polymerase sigma factor (sigma-70 family)